MGEEMTHSIKQLYQAPQQLIRSSGIDRKWGWGATLSLPHRVEEGKRQSPHPTPAFHNYNKTSRACSRESWSYKRHADEGDTASMLSADSDSQPLLSFKADKCECIGQGRCQRGSMLGGGGQAPPPQAWRLPCCYFTF